MEIIVGIVVGTALAGVVSWLALRRRGDADRIERAVALAVSEQRAQAGTERDAAIHAAVQQVIVQNREAMTRERELHTNELRGEKSLIDQQLSLLRQEVHGVGEVVQKLEGDRRSAHAGLTEQVRSLNEAQEMLRTETANLATALRSPAVRGRWGEMQLRRVIELAGMMPNCDFVEQKTVSTADGRVRPDVIVHLPGDKSVVVDAKVPLHAFLESVEAQDIETQNVRLASHARQVRSHVDALASKEYWAQFQDAPDFVVMFVPGDQLLAAALEQDPSLMEHSVNSRVLIATPVTLIALLRSVAYGWQQDALAENARQIAELGRQLESRLATFGGHLAKVGRGLETAVGAYNEAVGSYESRVLVGARRLGELESTERELEAPPQVERRTRRPLPDRTPSDVIPFDRGEDDEGPTKLALEA